MSEICIMTDAELADNDLDPLRDCLVCRRPATQCDDRTHSNYVEVTEPCSACGFPMRIHRGNDRSRCPDQYAIDAYEQEQQETNENQNIASDDQSGKCNVVTDLVEREAMLSALLSFASLCTIAGLKGIVAECEFVDGWLSHSNHKHLHNAIDARNMRPETKRQKLGEAFFLGHHAREKWIVEQIVNGGAT